MDRPDKRNYTYMTGVLRDQGLAAGKEQWQELIDYYFARGNCVDALDKAVGAAASSSSFPIRSSTIIGSTR